MTYEQVNHILDHLQRIHGEAAECCSLLESASDERLRLLATVFRQRQEALGARLTPLETQEHARAADTWLQYTFTEPVEKALDALRESGRECADTIPAKCLALQEQIVQLLRHLAEEVSAPTTREVLDDVGTAEESALKQLSLVKLTERDA